MIPHPLDPLIADIRANLAYVLRVAALIVVACAVLVLVI